MESLTENSEAQHALDMEYEVAKVEPRVEPMCEETKSHITNQTVGPENGAIRCLFKVSIRQFVGQRINLEALNNNWLIRAHSIEAFRTYLWELAAPHIKQAIDVETDKDGVLNVSWGDPTRPTIEQADHYISFADRKIRKNYPWKHLTSAALERWHNSTTIVVCVHVHSMAVYSRPVYEIVLDKLLQPKTPKPKPRPALPEGADGYSFRDEVRAIRDTFLQMRDLMHILDNRITLLEEKCDHTVPHEPMIQMRIELGEGAADVKSFGDPLQCGDIKEEDDEEDEYE